MSADRVEEFRQQGVASMMAGHHEEAIPFFDQALALGPDDETRDLLIVNKASAQLYLKLNTPEIQQLPQIILRRPKLRGLAAYHLAAKFENEKDYKRAQVYLEIALRAAEAEQDERLRMVTLIDLGNVAGYDSRFAESLEHFEAALQIPATNSERRLWHAFAHQGIGYSSIMLDQPAKGIEHVKTAIGMLRELGTHAYQAEGFIDLCLAYLELGDLDQARQYGELGINGATEERQIRNGHYLLGEIAYKSGDIETAKGHFSQLAAFYPQFPQLTNVLFALDLRKMVNFRL